jgi:two-component sensor histidine kinase
MRILLLKLLLLSSLYILAQKDSSTYFLKQLNKKGQPDSLQTFFNIKLADLYLDNSPLRALNYSKKALQLANHTGSDKMIYLAANNAARSFLNLGFYDSSLYYAIQCNDAAIKLDNPSFIFISLNLLGNSYFSKGDLSKAKKNYDEALKMSLTNPSIVHISRIYINLGNYYYRATFATKKSIDLLRQGEAIAAKSGDYEDLMGIYSALGYMYVSSHKVDSGQQYMMTALDYYHKAGKLRDEARINQNLGSVYGQLKNIDRMEYYLDNSYKQFLSIGDNVSASQSLLNKMNTYFVTLKYDKCLQTLNTVEPVAFKNNNTGILSLCYAYKAAIFSLLQDSVNSAKYQRMGNNISVNVSDSSIKKLNKTIAVLITSSTSALNKNDTAVKKALLEAKKWIPASVMETSFESVTLNKEIVQANKKELADISHTMLPGDGLNEKQRLDSLIRQSNNSNLAAVYNKQMTEMEIKYKTKQKNDSIQSQTELIAFKNKSINTRNYFLAGLALLTFLILILFLRSNSQAKKINRQYSQILQLQSELTHRTGNFFNSIKGMLSVASATTTDSRTISSLNSRVSTINHLYTTLYSSPDKSQLPFSELLASICNDFEHSFGSEKKIKIYHQANAQISKEESVPLAFIVAELLTNAVKHAFEGKDVGEIHVQVSTDNDKRFLHVWDNGAGKDENSKPRQGSQGMSIIRSYCKNLAGTFSSWNDNGFHYKMEF